MLPVADYCRYYAPCCFFLMLFFDAASPLFFAMSRFSFDAADCQDFYYLLTSPILRYFQDNACRRLPSRHIVSSPDAAFCRYNIDRLVRTSRYGAGMTKLGTGEGVVTTNGQLFAALLSFYRALRHDCIWLSFSSATDIFFFSTECITPSYHADNCYIRHCCRL